jgi:hypothetical protein
VATRQKEEGRQRAVALLTEGGHHALNRHGRLEALIVLEHQPARVAVAGEMDATRLRACDSVDQIVEGPQLGRGLWTVIGQGVRDAIALFFVTQRAAFGAAMCVTTVNGSLGGVICVSNCTASVVLRMTSSTPSRTRKRDSW